MPTAKKPKAKKAENRDSNTRAVQLSKEAIRWVVLLKEFDRLAWLLHDAKQDGVIDNERYGTALDHLYESRDEIQASDVPD